MKKESQKLRLGKMKIDKPLGSFDLKDYLETQKKIVESALVRWLPIGEKYSSIVFEAMKYSLMAGGKRIRPILLLSSVKAVGGNEKQALPFACALECIHTYSLIHDDLPAMDDDDLRRGKPSCHKAYGEAIAILAGDGLLTLAFELMTEPKLISSLDPSMQNKAIFLLARAAGVHGMVGGQTADLQMEGKKIDGEILNFIHTKKTGALISASVEMGGLLGSGNESQMKSLTQYGNAIGLAFQIRDDIMDLEGDEKLMGKPRGSDEKRKKATYPALFGLKKSKVEMKRLVNKAISALDIFGHEGEPLMAIAKYLVKRDR